MRRGQSTLLYAKRRIKHGEHARVNHGNGEHRETDDMIAWLLFPRMAAFPKDGSFVRSRKGYPSKVELDFCQV